MMTTATKRPKYGRRSPKNAPAIMFAPLNRLRDRALPQYPPVDYLKGIDWSATMNGNDKAGDCVACAWANIRTVTTNGLTDTTERPSQAQVWAVYRTQNPDFDPKGTKKTNGPGSDADGGMDCQTLCEYLVHAGGPDGVKALGFVKVDHLNLTELRDAISLGGCLLLGVDVAAAQQDQFPNVWDFVTGSPIEGGHAIVAGGHLNTPADDVKAVCWASEFGIADMFMTKQLREAWLIVWPEHVGDRRFMSGFDFAGFAAAFEDITGAPFPVQPAPVPVTPPAPAPGPAPHGGPSALDVAYAAEVKDWAFNHHHTGTTAHIAAATRVWITANGL